MQKSKVLDNMTGHLTVGEREARGERERMMSRREVRLIMPEYLDGDGAAVWEKLVSDAAELKLFDDLDAETLGSYCSVTSRILTLRRKYSSCLRGHRKNSELLDISKELRLLESLQLSYATRLGLTPESRARLAASMPSSADENPADDLYTDEGSARHCNYLYSRILRHNSRGTADCIKHRNCRDTDYGTKKIRTYCIRRDNT